MATHKLNDERECPNCGELLDAATNAELGHETQPKPGDFTLCVRCASVLVFGGDMNLRAAQMDDFAEMKPEQLMALSHARQALAKLIEKRNREQPDITSIIPGGIKPTDFCHKETNDNTCSRCRRAIREDEIPITLWRDSDPNDMWIFCNDCTPNLAGFDVAAEGEEGK